VTSDAKTRVGRQNGASSSSGLAVEGVSVESVAPHVNIVDDIWFCVAKGETLGLVGESGCGKTTVAFGLLGYARPGTRIVCGSVVINGIDVLALSKAELRRQRGTLISFVPQDPSTALSPGMRIGRQVLEVVETHYPKDPNPLERVSSALTAAQLPTGSSFLRRYPHQLSGGQQQRVAIAMALACEPQVIVMDEPTTGLDVTTQARLLDVIGRLLRDRDLAVVYISHDLAVIRNLATRVAVMYGGRIVEEACVDDLFADPWHPYTQGLLRAIPRVRGNISELRGIPGVAVEPWNRPRGCPFAPRCDFRSQRAEEELPPVERLADRSIRCWRWRELRETVSAVPHSNALGRVESGAVGGDVVEAVSSGLLLEIRDVVVAYGRARRFSRSQRQTTFAVHGVSIQVPERACIAIVGETGSGKTTLLRCVIGLHAPTAGEILFRNDVVSPHARERSDELRRLIQLVPQNPDSSLNPRQEVGTIIGRPLRLFFGLRGRQQRERVGELLEVVKLPPAITSRLPRELSGGEKQRVAIARALAAQPQLLLCDEITAALDVAVQAEILTLLGELRESLGMAMIFVSHDLAIVRTVSDEVVVMRDGRVHEVGPTVALYESPEAQYTQELLRAVPDLQETDYPRPVRPLARCGRGASNESRS
jgi:peptide/nickel transport system ATP-binding protein